MFVQALQSVVLLHTLLHSAHAFWWPPPATTARTTTAEATSTALKQIPLTYFRTYTYQPLPGNPYAFPFFSSMHSPLLTPPRYEQYVSNYGNNNYSPLLPQEPILAGKPQPSNAAAAIHTMPPTRATTTTTSTTTTTTPAPTTTTSTTTTSAPLPPPPPPTQPLIDAYAGAYPTFNRRNYLTASQYAYRPHYPYPEYSLYKTQPNGAYMANGNAARIQFVPCMCPVRTAGNGLPLGPTASAAYLAQARTADDDDDDDGAMLADADADADVNVDAETVQDRDMTLPAAQTETENQSKSKIVIEAEMVQKSEVKPLAALPGQLASNKIDVETQTDNEAGV